MIPKTFELVWQSKTYTTRKVTPVLKGSLLRLLALSQRDLGDASINDVQNNQNLQLLVASNIYQYAPEVMWTFLTPESKTEIGTQEDFIENLQLPVISAFFHWGMSVVQETESFLEASPVSSPVRSKPSKSTTSTPSSAEDTAGV